METPPDKISLEFSDKYDPKHAQQYFDKHQATFARRMSNWRDVQMARRALHLAGDPNVVLDLPCGAGRFWSVLSEQAGRSIIGADNSASMLDVAMKSQPQSITQHVTPLQTSAFAIDLPDSAVDNIFCIRLLHHIGQKEHRLKILNEFHRVTRDTVILSLWVDGNYKAWRRKKLEAKKAATRKEGDYQNRFVIPTKEVEKEFVDAGFSIVSSIDFLPFYAMWRVYILRKNK